MLVHLCSDLELHMELEWRSDSNDRILAMRILNELHVLKSPERVYIILTREGLDNEKSQDKLQGGGDTSHTAGHHRQTDLFEEFTT